MCALSTVERDSYLMMMNSVDSFFGFEKKKKKTRHNIMRVEEIRSGQKGVRLMDEGKEIFFFLDAICFVSSFPFVCLNSFSLALTLYEDEFDSHLPLSLCDMNGHYKRAMTAKRGHWTTECLRFFSSFSYSSTHQWKKDLF